MKQKFTVLLCILLLLPVLLLNVSAAEPCVVDNADLLTASEETALESTIAELREMYGMDVVILTELSLHGQRPQDYADNYYDSYGYADDGLLFLLSMEERDWYISTCGDVIYVLTDYGIQQLGEAVIPYFSAGKYGDGFSLFLTVLPGYLDAFVEGHPIDGYADYSGDYYHGDREEVLYYEEEFTPSFFLSLIVGLVIALIAILVMRAGMRTGKRQRSAGVYLLDDTYRLTVQRDMFLYSNVSKVRKPQNNSSGGGSSVHRSGGGRSHGGGGGKF